VRVALSEPGGQGARVATTDNDDLPI
jgi:hypothetical protein